MHKIASFFHFGGQGGGVKILELILKILFQDLCSTGNKNQMGFFKQGFALFKSESNDLFTPYLTKPPQYSYLTRQVCNLFQEPVEQPLLDFRIAEENQTGSIL